MTVKPIVQTRGPVRTADGIVEAATRSASTLGPVDVAVAAAADEAALEAVATAAGLGICRPALFGCARRIREIAGSAGLDLRLATVEDVPDDAAAAREAVIAADQGRAGVIMKGFIGTSALLKTVLSREFSLRGKGTISHTAVLEIPGLGRLVGITDGGVVVKPELSTAPSMIANSRIVFNALGVDRPRLALLSDHDSAPEDLPPSALWRELSRMHATGGIPGVEMHGPLTLESALLPEAAAPIAGRAAGDADILLAGSIEECNVVSKALIIFAGAVFAGVITGARVPVSLVSRTDSARNKLCSLSLACLVSRLGRDGGGSNGN